MLSQNIQQLINEAMKSGDKIRMETLKMLSAEFHKAEINKGLNSELTENEELTVINREAKKRKDAIEALRQAQGRQTSSDEEGIRQKLELEQAELTILEEFLPAQLTDEELSLMVDKAIGLVGAGDVRDIGRVMGKAMELSQGRADGKRISELVKQKLI